MRTYVVNLRRRNDRRTQMERALADRSDVVFTSDWDGPFDGTTIDMNALDGYRPHPGWKLPVVSGHAYWDRDLRPGEVGCSISHLACWRHAAEVDASSPMLVLEDDVDVPADLDERLSSLCADVDALDPDWGLLYLGRSGRTRDETVAPGVLRVGFSYGSFGYVLSASGLASVLAAGLENGVIPLDEFLPAMYLDHPRPDVRMLYPKRFCAYAGVDDLVVHVPDGSSDT